MEEAACFGSQAEVPGTRERGERGKQRPSGEERPVNAITPVSQERRGSRRGASGSWSCFLLVSEAAPTKFGESGFGWLQFTSKGEETRPTIAPFPAPHTHTVGTGGVGAGRGAATEK